MPLSMPFTVAASLIALGFAAAVTTSPQAAAAPTVVRAPGSVDWPHFRFDKHHTGFQPEHGYGGRLYVFGLAL